MSTFEGYGAFKRKEFADILSFLSRPFVEGDLRRVKQTGSHKSCLPCEIGRISDMADMLFCWFCHEVTHIDLSM